MPENPLYFELFFHKKSSWHRICSKIVINITMCLFAEKDKNVYFYQQVNYFSNVFTLLENRP